MRPEIASGIERLVDKFVEMCEEEKGASVDVYV